MIYIIHTSSNELYHHGILGQKWGVRRYQNSDGTLTKAGRRHLAQIENRDNKWADKHYDKIMNKAYKPIKTDIKQYDRYLKMNNVSGKTFVNAHNRKLSELMNTKSPEIYTPSGRVVKFVAKRGTLGVHMAVTDKGYDMNNLKNGVWGNGRIAYKKSSVKMT